MIVSLNYTIEVCQKLPFGEQSYSKTQRREHFEQRLCHYNLWVFSIDNPIYWFYQRKVKVSIKLKENQNKIAFSVMLTDTYTVQI